MNNRVEAVRVQPFWNTTAGWAADVASANPFIPELGELVVEQLGSGSSQVKLGDGINNWSLLPYVGAGSATSTSDGTYIDIAIPSTNPGVVTTDSFYFAQTPGNYVNFPTSGTASVVMPSTATLGVISFKTATGFWTYRTLNSATSSSIPNLESVLLSGNTTDQTALFANGTNTLFTSIGDSAIATSSFPSSSANGNSVVIHAAEIDFFQIVASVPKSLKIEASTLSANQIETLQNRSGTIATVEPRIETAASYTTSHTINTDLFDWSIITAQAGALLFNNPTITPQSGETGYGRTFCISILDNGTARALTWGTNWLGDFIGLPLPSTTVLGKRMVMEFSYLDDAKVHLIGIAVQS